MGNIAFAHGCWQGNHCGTVIQGGAAADILGRQREKIATTNLDVLTTVDLESATLLHLRLQLVLIEEVLHGPL
ncbi:hypothetical protein D3C78_1438700 [compost metagenome]